MANSVFEAVREGMNFFADPFWRGPKPNVETLFEVSLVGDERVWRVTAVGLGLLISDRLDKDQRRAAGWALLGFGVVSTIPIARGVLAKPLIAE
jgi:hypothetical protein